ncbi:MAG: prepilin-type N-terminal cleavage/methylation domain-containing protein [Pseudobacteriovorax sp.]|nr:prepilin-type N-terminal cleavage/methylation domain-containing protein [Pseudobacteriovorax sp.]
MKLIKGLNLRDSEGGFSLVELMIVVGIIGVLATLAMPRFRQFQAKAKMGEAKNNLTHIFTLQQSYQLDENEYLGWNASYGRNANGTVTCQAPAQAQDIGFEITPCTNAAAPVPRYGYTSVVAAATRRSQFSAQARSGTNANNLVCPGQGQHGFSMNQNKEFSDRLIGNTRAMRLCF